MPFVVRNAERLLHLLERIHLGLLDLLFHDIQMAYDLRLQSFGECLLIDISVFLERDPSGFRGRPQR